MSQEQNIQIPRSLFDQISSLVEYLAIKDYRIPQTFKINDILLGLRKKRHSINLRAAYSNIIYSSEDKKREAQRNYQMLKHKNGTLNLPTR